VHRLFTKIAKTAAPEGLLPFQEALETEN